MACYETNILWNSEKFKFADSNQKFEKKYPNKIWRRNIPIEWN